MRVEVWFVDHGSVLHCTRSRPIRLYEDCSSWESSMAGAWNDYVIPGTPLEFHLVDPAPPHMPNDVAAHVIIVQRPHDELVTSLLSVYPGPQAQGQPALQNAITTHEHIWIQDLARGLGLETQCFRSPVSHICEAWYGSFELQRTAPLAPRSGHGLLFLFFPHEPVEDSVALLQLHTLLDPPHERLTHGQVLKPMGRVEGRS